MLWLIFLYVSFKRFNNTRTHLNKKSYVCVYVFISNQTPLHLFTYTLVFKNETLFRIFDLNNLGIIIIIISGHMFFCLFCYQVETE